MGISVPQMFGSSRQRHSLSCESRNAGNGHHHRTRSSPTDKESSSHAVFCEGHMTLSMLVIRHSVLFFCAVHFSSSRDLGMLSYAPERQNHSDSLWHLLLQEFDWALRLLSSQLVLNCALHSRSARACQPDCMTAEGLEKCVDHNC